MTECSHYHGRALTDSVLPALLAGVKNAQFALFVCCAAVSVAAMATTLRGTVLRVIDGDTALVLVNGLEVTVRIAGIDAPESCQPGGDRATQVLHDLVQGDYVLLEPQGRDQFGRTLARVKTPSGMDVGRQMVESGLAWVYPGKTPNGEDRLAEERARRYTVGVWSLASPVPPWEWRKMNPACPATTPAAVARNPAVTSATVDAALSALDMRSRAESSVPALAPISPSYGPGAISGSSSGRGPIYTGPKGGEFYRTESGNKQYIKR